MVNCLSIEQRTRPNIDNSTTPLPDSALPALQVMAGIRWKNKTNLAI
jgi:hypothetical protein